MSGRSVHAVVVAYHAPEQLERCLDALAGGPPVTVVDNSSSGLVRTVAAARGAAYVDAERNLGFAGGANVALRELQTDDDVLFVNPDAVVTPDAVAALAACLERPGNERVAAVAPRLVGADGGEQRVLWPFPSPLRACAEAVGLGHRVPRRSFAIGAVLLVRGAALRDVGLFDERFFLYAEETDWQRRALDRSWTSALCDAASARHAGGGASDDPLRRELLFHAAQETYIRKWYGAAGWALYRLAACAGSVVRAIALTGDRRRQAARRALLYLRGPRRCAGLDVA